LIVEKDKVPVAVAPLEKPKGLFRAFELCGVKDHGEPGDFCYRDSASLDTLTDSLAKNKVPLFLSRIPAESPVMAAITNSYRHKGLVISRLQIGCPYIDIKLTVDDTINQLSSRLRSDLRRARRKAEALGKIEFEIHSPCTPDDLLPLWEEAIGIEAMGWKGRSESALKKDKRRGSFYKDYAIKACEKGWLRICFMRIKNQVVAMQIAIESSERFWLLKIGYDEGFSNASPGMLLMNETLRYAAEKNLKSYEFLGTADTWTRRWTKNERDNYTIRTFPYSVKGVILFGSFTGTYIWHKIRRLFRSK
jgi:hypothetical protein